MSTAAAPAHEATAPAHHCPLCGYRFHQGAEHCVACPMATGCGSTQCPNCGYEFLDRSATVDALKRLGGRLLRLVSSIRGGPEPSR